MNHSRILELDGLRAFAIAAVMLFHVSSSRWVMLGWAGVDLFFVISGFLITGILLDLRSDSMPYRKFYWRRTIRILPAYYAVLFLIAIVGLGFAREPLESSQWLSPLFFLPAVHRGISAHLVLNRISGALPWIDHSIGRYAPYGPKSLFLDSLVPFWSLAVEELFYLAWAPIVLKTNRRWIVVFAVAPILLCPALRFATHGPDGCGYLEYFGFLTRFDALSIGACVCLILRAKSDAPKRLLKLSFPGLLGVVVWLCIHCGVTHGIEIRSTEMFGVFGYSALALMFAAVIAICVEASGQGAFRWLRFKPLVYLGTISYTMYLAHDFFFVIAVRSLSSTLLRGLVAMAATIGLAAISRKYFESPILKLRDQIPFSNSVHLRPGAIENAAHAVSDTAGVS